MASTAGETKPPLSLGEKLYSGVASTAASVGGAVRAIAGATTEVILNADCVVEGILGMDHWNDLPKELTHLDVSLLIALSDTLQPLEDTLATMRATLLDTVQTFSEAATKTARQQELSATYEVSDAMRSPEKQKPLREGTDRAHVASVLCVAFHVLPLLREAAGALRDDAGFSGAQARILAQLQQLSGYGTRLGWPTGSATAWDTFAATCISVVVSLHPEHGAMSALVHNLQEGTNSVSRAIACGVNSGVSKVISSVTTPAAAPASGATAAASGSAAAVTNAAAAVTKTNADNAPVGAQVSGAQVAGAAKAAVVPLLNAVESGFVKGTEKLAQTAAEEVLDSTVAAAAAVASTATSKVATAQVSYGQIAGKALGYINPINKAQAAVVQKQTLRIRKNAFLAFMSALLELFDGVTLD